VPALGDRLADAGYGLGWSAVCRLPESWAQRGFRFTADRAWRRRGPGVQVLEGNLRRVIGSQAPGGELRALSRQAMRSYARYWLEAFRLPVMPAGRLIGGMHDTGHIRAAFGYLAAGRMMGGPAALAVQTGAALMPVILWFEGDHWGAHVHAEIPVPAEGDSKQKTAAMMQQVARLFEAGIRAHPQDWHMLQRVFAADLDPARLAAAQSAAGTGRSEGGS